ncbi:MAG: hypothetical protein AAF074_21985 [Pseudomonadota bacterium]
MDRASTTIDQISERERTALNCLRMAHLSTDPPPVRNGAAEALIKLGLAELCAGELALTSLGKRVACQLR